MAKKKQVIENEGIKRPQVRSVEKKNAILKTVIQFLRTHNWEDLTTIKVAELAKIGIGTVYFHFRNKEEILRAIILNQFDEDFATIEKIANADDIQSLEDSVKKIIHAGVELFRDNDQLRRMIWEEKGSFNVVEAKLELEKRLRGLFMAQFDRHSKGKYKRPCELGIYILTQSVIGAFYSACVSRPELLTSDAHYFEYELNRLIMGYVELEKI